MNVMRHGSKAMTKASLIIDVDDLDFVNKPEDLGKIIEMIDAEINGLF